MLRFQEVSGEQSRSLRRLVNIRMRQLNVWPMLMMLILVVFLIYWLSGGFAH